jgi:hypothetical protein
MTKGDLKESRMKLLAALALATLVASPALAQDPPARASKARQTHSTPAAGAYNQDGRTDSRSRHSTNPAHDVWSNGAYLGSDPDPRIRRELARDYVAER